MFSADLITLLCRRGCPIRAGPPWWVGPPTGSPSPVLYGPFSGVAWNESPLALTISWPGHYDSQARELDTQRWGPQESRWAVGDSCTSIYWRSAGHWGKGDGKHTGKGQQILTEARDSPTTSNFGHLDSWCLSPSDPMPHQPQRYGQHVL